MVLSEFPNEVHDKHWRRRLITHEPCLKHFSKNTAQAPDWTFHFYNLSRHPCTSWQKKLLLSGSLLVKTELQLFNSSPRVLRFRVCHCDMRGGTDDLRVLAEDGLEGFIPVNHGTKHQRLEDQTEENKRGHTYSRHTRGENNVWILTQDTLPSVYMVWLLRFPSQIQAILIKPYTGTIKKADQIHGYSVSTSRKLSQNCK